MNSPLPSFFISHGGGPCFFMDWNPADAWEPLARSLRELPDHVGARPRAIVVISAHWEAPVFTVTAQAQPPLIYDYSGFPPHTYELQYPAPGSPPLAQQLVQLLAAAGLEARPDQQRGFDHGVFVPFKLIYPDADIPIVQLSLHASLDAGLHLRAGRALAALREQGVLIVGSGYSYHNMRGFGGAGEPAAREFDAWLGDTLCRQTPANREQRLADWSSAPSAREAHPREEHLLPLMVAAASAHDAPGLRLLGEPVWGITTSAFQFGASAT